MLLSIAKRITSLRGEKTQKEFSDILGITQSHLSQFELGKVKPTTDFYVAVADVLNVNLNWLLTGKGDKYVTYYGNQELVQENLTLKDTIKKMDNTFADAISNINKISKLESIRKKVKSKH